MEFLSKEFIQKILEKLVVDNEICGMAYRATEGISQRDDPVAENLFEGFTQETQFLTMPHTQKWYRKEHTFPEIIDQDTYDYWVSMGKKSIADRASKEVERVLKEISPTHLGEDIVQELRKIMDSDVKIYDIASLPKIKS